MSWILVVLAAVAVFAIAAAFVGSEAFRLGHETPAAIFDVDEAVDAVADALPDDAQARLSYDEVCRLILATLEHLRDKGISALPGEDLPEGPSEELVIDDAEALAAVLGAVEADGLDIVDEDAALVIQRLLTHLAEIGALGPQA